MKRALPARGADRGNTRGMMYTAFFNRVAHARERLARPLTFAEKILAAHADAWPRELILRESTVLPLRPDRIALQDSLAPRVLSEFIADGSDEPAVPTSIHCDHRLRINAYADGHFSSAADQELRDFLLSGALRYNMDFWMPGAGILHQVIFDHYAVPGELLFGTDSHAGHAGGLGALAFAVKGDSALRCMIGEIMPLALPRLVGVRLEGALRGWASPKDVALRLAGLISLGGSASAIIEFFGPGAESLDCSGKATIANIGAELGAYSSVFPFDCEMHEYLVATGREGVANAAAAAASSLAADPAVQANPESFFDEVLEVDLAEVQPSWAGPHSLDLVRSVRSIRDVIEREGYQSKVAAGLIGGCSNSSYEDLSRAGAIAAQAAAAGMRAKAPLTITPGSLSIYEALSETGAVGQLTAIGAEIVTNGCGSCIDARHTRGGREGVRVTSLNRCDMNSENACVTFVGSAELVVLAVLAGSLSFNPETDSLSAGSGEKAVFTAPGPIPPPGNRGLADTRQLISPPETAVERRKVRVRTYG